jgi:hypothetical protein
MRQSTRRLPPTGCHGNFIQKYLEALTIMPNAVRSPQRRGTCFIMNTTFRRGWQLLEAVQSRDKGAVIARLSKESSLRFLLLLARLSNRHSLSIVVCVGWAHNWHRHTHTGRQFCGQAGLLHDRHSIAAKRRTRLMFEHCLKQKLRTILEDLRFSQRWLKKVIFWDIKTPSVPHRKHSNYRYSVQPVNAV